MSRQTAIRCTLMRGGTSKGAYFLAADLPPTPPTRDRVLLAALGSPDARQVDGIGGAHPLTSKVAIVSPVDAARTPTSITCSRRSVVDEARVDTTPTCGNILAGVGPFAIERGLVAATGDETTCASASVNTGSRCRGAASRRRAARSTTRRRRASAACRAPPRRSLLDLRRHRRLESAARCCRRATPRDVIDGVPVTCIDNGMPVVRDARPRDLGRTGYETPDAAQRGRASSRRGSRRSGSPPGPLMNLGDVRDKRRAQDDAGGAGRATAARSARARSSRTICHAAIGVLGAVTVATACVIAGTVAAAVARSRRRIPKPLSVEHPTGEFTVELGLRDAAGTPARPVDRASLLRTAWARRRALLVRRRYGMDAPQLP